MPDPVPDSFEAFTEIVTTEGDAFAATAEIAVAVFALLIVMFELPVVVAAAADVVWSAGRTARAMPAPAPPPIRAAPPAAAARGTSGPRRRPGARKDEPSPSGTAVAAGAASTGAAGAACASST